MEEIAQSPVRTKSSFSFWRGLTIALWLLAAQIIVAIPAVIIAYLVSDEGNIDAAVTNSIGVVLIVSFPLAVWLALRNWNLNMDDFVWTKRLVVPAVFALILTLAVSFLFGELLTHLPNYEEMLESYNELFGQIKPIYLLLGGVLIGPICEELIFRGIILKEFLKAHDPAKAILFSAMIFGIIHGIAIQVLYAFLLGLVLGWIYYRTRSLLICIGLHIINNALAFSGGEESAESLGAGMGTGSYIGLLLLAIVVIGAAAYLFDQRTPNVSEERETARRIALDLADSEEE